MASLTSTIMGTGNKFSTTTSVEDILVFVVTNPDIANPYGARC